MSPGPDPPTHPRTASMNRTRTLFLFGAFLFLAAGTAGLRTASAHGPWGGRGLAFDGSMAEREAAMAEALGTTVDKLRAAQDKVFQDHLAQAVADGRLTQERADLMTAGRKLSRSIDPQSVMAQALGLSTEDYRKALADGQSPLDLAEAKDLDRAGLHEALQKAQEEALAKAVTDGVITQAQADQLREAQTSARGFGHFGKGMGGFGRGHGFGWGGCPHGGPGKNQAAPDAEGSGGVRFRPAGQAWGSSDA